MATGADDFVRKPITEEALLAVIERHLGLRFEYAAETPEARPITDERRITELVQQVSPDLLGDMRSAVFRSDDLTMLALIGQLPPDLNDLALTLRHLVNRFAWETLESALAPAPAATP